MPQRVVPVERLEVRDSLEMPVVPEQGVYKLLSTNQQLTSGGIDEEPASS